MTTRVFYIGKDRLVDPRFNRELYPGYAMDCPDEMAKALLAEGCFSTRPGAPVDARPATEITWYKPEPGVELLALDGVGKGRASAMVGAGVSFLDDLIALDDAGAERLASAMKGVSLDDVRTWISQARKIKEV